MTAGRDDGEPAPPVLGHVLPVGTRLADYTIEGLIGEGGFGVVYLATDHSLERRVALKEYVPSAIASRVVGSAEIVVKSERHRETFRAGLKSFLNEARLLARFDHPSLVKVFRFWEANGTAYMAMPFYEGPTLKAALDALGRPPAEAELEAWIAPLVDALSVLHAAHCFHRDIAPDNILLTRSGPLLLDFGAARRVIGDLTHALTVVLKPGFAPIEQYGEAKSMAQGAWTDFYALASVVRFAITGTAPVSAVERLMDDRLEPLASLARGRYSPRFLDGLDRALAVRPADRPQDAREFREALGLPVAAAVAVVTVPSALDGAGGREGDGHDGDTADAPLDWQHTAPHSPRDAMRPTAPAGAGRTVPQTAPWLVPTHVATDIEPRAGRSEWLASPIQRASVAKSALAETQTASLMADGSVWPQPVSAIRPSEPSLVPSSGTPHRRAAAAPPTPSAVHRRARRSWLPWLGAGAASAALVGGLVAVLDRPVPEAPGARPSSAAATGTAALAPRPTPTPAQTSAPTAPASTQTQAPTQTQTPTPSPTPSPSPDPIPTREVTPRVEPKPAPLATSPAPAAPSISAAPAPEATAVRADAPPSARRDPQPSSLPDPDRSPPRVRARDEPAIAPSPRERPPRTAAGERCSDILRKGSLEPLSADESAYLQRECR